MSRGVSVKRASVTRASVKRGECQEVSRGVSVKRGSVTRGPQQEILHLITTSHEPHSDLAQAQAAAKVEGVQPGGCGHRPAAWVWCWGQIRRLLLM